MKGTSILYILLVKAEFHSEKDSITSNKWNSKEWYQYLILSWILDSLPHI